MRCKWIPSCLCGLLLLCCSVVSGQDSGSVSWTQANGKASLMLDVEDGYTISYRFKSTEVAEPVDYAQVCLFRDDRIAVSWDGYDGAVFVWYWNGSAWGYELLDGGGDLRDLRGSFREVTGSVVFNSSTSSTVSVALNGAAWFERTLSHAGRGGDSVTLVWAGAGSSVPFGGANAAEFQVGRTIITEELLVDGGGVVSGNYVSGQVVASTYLAAFAMDDVDPDVDYPDRLNHVGARTLIAPLFWGVTTFVTGPVDSVTLHPRIVESRSEGQAEALILVGEAEDFSEDAELAAADAEAMAVDWLTDPANPGGDPDSLLTGYVEAAVEAAEDAAAAYASSLSAYNASNYAAVEAFRDAAASGASDAAAGLASAAARYGFLGGGGGQSGGPGSSGNPLDPPNCTPCLYCSNNPVYRPSNPGCDYDQDGTANEFDSDADNDGISNNDDCHPFGADDGRGWLSTCNEGSCVSGSDDLDGDGRVNSSDGDDDGDGLTDGQGCERPPCLVESPCDAWQDHDGDNICDHEDPVLDSDGDGCPDGRDLDFGEWLPELGAGTQITNEGSFECDTVTRSYALMCDRAEIRDYDGDEVLNPDDAYPCGDGTGENPLFSGCTSAEWDACLTLINANSNCSGCPEEEDIAEGELCGAYLVEGDEWNGHPYANCDYDEDGCANRIDTAPCDGAQGCKCRIDIVGRFAELQTVLVQWLTSSSSEQIRDYEWPELVTDPDCVRCAEPPSVDAPFWTWTFTDASLVPYGGQSVTWGISLRLALAENADAMFGPSYPALKRVFDNGIWLINWIIIFFASWTCAWSMLRSIGEL